jgi:hypothetical protein
VWRAVSFLIDPPLLLADGEFFGRAAPESAQGRVALAAGALTTGIFWAAGAAFWRDHPAVTPFRRRLGYHSGRDFMLRYPLAARGRRHRRDRREDALALAAFASYPLWWWLGWDHGRRARPTGA